MRAMGGSGRDPAVCEDAVASVRSEGSEVALVATGPATADEEKEKADKGEEEKRAEHDREDDG